VSVELTAENRKALYVPAMFAHGYQTLVDGTEVIYQVSWAYHAGRRARPGGYDDRR
jgi:dTDP-4-dehydrorhamnose 3,5-epimerase